MISRIKILGTHVDTIDKLRLDDHIEEFIGLNQKSIVSNVNVQALNIAFKNNWFRDFLNQSDIVFCDGFGVKVAAKILGYDIHERITYADWTWDLAELCERNNYSLYFLGGKQQVPELVAQNLKKRFHSLKVIGTHHGFFNKTPGHPENEAVIQSINALKPDILLVGFGMPLQEKWIMENFDRLDVKVFLPVGAAFDYVSGNVRRAPRWMTDHGLEWLGRLIIEPRRLWKRYIIGIPVFFYRVLLQKFGLIKYD
jgi:N-acetylglucosaminyldiphosphoundecaprenol N-acetyl-beta-D-mannosaminyltransferase